MVAKSMIPGRPLELVITLSYHTMQGKAIGSIGMQSSHASLVQAQPLASATIVQSRALFGNLRHDCLSFFEDCEQSKDPTHIEHDASTSPPRLDCLRRRTMVPMPASASKSKAKQVPAQVQDFTALPLRLPQQRSYQREATHYLYLRPNRPRVPTPDTEREIFLVNVPFDSTLQNLRILFADELGGGRVEDVEFEETGAVGKGIKAPAVVGSEGGAGKKSKKRKRGAEEHAEGEGEEVGQLPPTCERPLHRSGATAVLRFVDATSAALALRAASKAAKTGRPAQWPTTAEAEEGEALGEKRYKAHHTLRHPSHTTLQESIETYMTAYTAAEASASAARVRQRAEPDAEGFVTVTRGGRNPAARSAPPPPADDAVGAEGGKKKKKRHKGHVEEGFYRFQVRERKKREHGELARKFEEDEKRVEALRRRRGGRVRPE